MKCGFLTTFVVTVFICNNLLLQKVTCPPTSPLCPNFKGWYKIPGYNSCFTVITGVAKGSAYLFLDTCNDQAKPYEAVMATIHNTTINTIICKALPKPVGYRIGVSLANGKWTYDNTGKEVTLNLWNKKSATSSGDCASLDGFACEWIRTSCIGLKFGIVCEMKDVDLCVANTGCHSSANCVPTGPRQVNCTCDKGKIMNADMECEDPPKKREKGSMMMYLLVSAIAIAGVGFFLFKKKSSPVQTVTKATGTKKSVTISVHEDKAEAEDQVAASQAGSDPEEQAAEVAEEGSGVHQSAGKGSDMDSGASIMDKTSNSNA